MSDPLGDRFKAAKAQIAKARETLTAAHEDLRTLQGEIRHARSRGNIQQEIWLLERALGHRDAYFSQSGQDAYLDEKVFRGKTGGTFVEIGGYDGVTGSNCLFFEMRRGWQGVIVEPSPTYHAACAAARRSPVLQLAIGAEEGVAEFLEVREGFRQMGGLVASYDPKLRAQVESDPRHQGAVIEVVVLPLADLLDRQGLTQIDYISLDVEGAELAILSDFPFARFEISALTVENSQGDQSVPQLMAQNGLHRVEAIGVDDVYVSDAVLQGLRR